MIPAYTPTQKRLMQDIVPPTVSDAETRAKRRKRRNIPVKYHGALLRNGGRMTRVPPMAIMHRPFQAAAATSIIELGPAVSTGIGWLPKKYTLNKGLVTDWHAKTFSELKFVAPALLGMYGLMLLALSWQLPHIQSLNGTRTRYVHSSNAKTASPPSAVVPASPSTSKPAVSTSTVSTQSQPVVTPTPTTAASQEAATTPGSGGGVAVPPVDAPPVDGDIVPPIEVAVPPVDAGAGDIQVQTPGIDITL